MELILTQHIQHRIHGKVSEQKLTRLDMTFYFEKSCCMRIGPFFNAKCNNLTASCGSKLQRVTEIKYPLTQNQTFKCSFDHAKRAFYRSLNVVFGIIGISAVEVVPYLYIIK